MWVRFENKKYNESNRDENIFLAVESAKLKLPTQAETTKNTKGMQKVKGRGVPYLPLKQIHTHTHTQTNNNSRCIKNGHTIEALPNSFDTYPLFPFDS